MKALETLDLEDGSLLNCKLTIFCYPFVCLILTFSSYNLTRIPVRPIYGGFPVKFRTHLGPPIYYEEGITPKELQEKTAAAIEKLIVENQRIPGSITAGIFDRFFERKQIDVVLNKTRQRRFISNKDT